MVPSASAQSCAVGSPRLPGPNSRTSSPAATGSSPVSTTNWSMHTLPEMRRRAPASQTSAVLVPLRGTPSAYPRGTRANPVAILVTYSCPYDTPDPAGTRLVSATWLRSVIAGVSPYGYGGTGVSP